LNRIEVKTRGEKVWQFDDWRNPDSLPEGGVVGKRRRAKVPSPPLFGKGI